MPRTGRRTKLISYQCRVLFQVAIILCWFSYSFLLISSIVFSAASTTSGVQNFPSCCNFCKVQQTTAQSDSKPRQGETTEEGRRKSSASHLTVKTFEQLRSTVPATIQRILQQIFCNTQPNRGGRVAQPHTLTQNHGPTDRTTTSFSGLKTHGSSFTSHTPLFLGWSLLSFGMNGTWSMFWPTWIFWTALALSRAFFRIGLRVQPLRALSAHFCTCSRMIVGRSSGFCKEHTNRQIGLVNIQHINKRGHMFKSQPRLLWEHFLSSSPENFWFLQNFRWKLLVPVPPGCFGQGYNQCLAEGTLFRNLFSRTWMANCLGFEVYTFLCSS